MVPPGPRRFCAASCPAPPLLDAHFVFDRLHTWHFTGSLDRFVDIGLGVDEAAELHQSLEGFDVDFGGLPGVISFLLQISVYIAGWW